MSGILLDTQAFLWWMAGNPRLGPKAREAIASGGTVCLSVVSLWEIAIKRSIGRTITGATTRELARLGYEEEGFRKLAVTAEDAIAVESLPMAHRDPFDRLLIVQAIAQNLAILTTDTAFGRYDVRKMSAAR